MIDREEVRRVLEQSERAMSQSGLSPVSHFGSDRAALLYLAARAYADQKPASDEWIDSWDAAAPDVQWSDQHAYHAGFAAGVAIAEWHHGIAPEIRTVPMPASWDGGTGNVHAIRARDVRAAEGETEAREGEAAVLRKALYDEGELIGREGDVLCVDCGEELPPGTEEHCGKPTDELMPCAFCGSGYWRNSSPCLRAAHERIAELSAELVAAKRHRRAPPRHPSARGRGRGGRVDG